MCFLADTGAAIFPMAKVSALFVGRTLPLRVTSRLCFATCHFFPLKGSKEASFETNKRRYTSSRRPLDIDGGSSSHFFLQRTIKFALLEDAGCATKVAAGEVGATVDVCSSPRGGKSMTGYLKNIEHKASGGVKGVGEGLPKASEDTPRQMRIQDLRIGCIYQGTVSAIESYGVFVDIGAYTDGFVHISRLCRSFVRRVEDVVQVGQDVTVQIVDLDIQANIISLLLEPEVGFTENVGLCPFSLSEREAVNRAAARRASKLAKRAEKSSPSWGMNPETRQRLKAYRRAVLAERQAIQLHHARSRVRSAANTPQSSLSSVDELDQGLKQCADDARNGPSSLVRDTQVKEVGASLHWNNSVNFS